MVEVLLIVQTTASILVSFELIWLILTISKGADSLRGGLGEEIVIEDVRSLRHRRGSTNGNVWVLEVDL